jgi:hypothetical protein
MEYELYLHGKAVRENGSFDSMWTRKVEHKITDTPRSGQTQTGYGEAIPTRYMVRFNNKWRRVYCAIFSNNGTLYIKAPKGEVILVKDHN